MALKKNPKYDLKRKYNRMLEISIILSLALLIAAFKFFPRFNSSNVKIDAPQELIDVEDVEITKQETAPPPPPKPPVPIEAPTDDVLEDIEIADTELNVEDQVTTPPPPPPADDEGEDVPDFFVVVEERPEPIGGLKAIQDRIEYPQFAIRATIQGRVYVRAYVNENGDVEKVELVKGISGGCDEEAMKAVKETKFKPGRQRGKAVKVQVVIPVLFKLN